MNNIIVRAAKSQMSIIGLKIVNL